MGDAYSDLDLTEQEAASQPSFARLDGFELNRAVFLAGAAVGLVSPFGPVVLTTGKAESEPFRVELPIGYAF